MHDWISAALDYVPRWLDYQMTSSEQPGCQVAIAHRGEVVFERAFGVANLATGEALTPHHRFRIASHSKTLTATAILLLRERGKLGLDDPAGRYVAGLHADVARATIGQLLSHSAGISRDGDDAGQFADRRPFRSLAELRADLAKPQPLGPSENMKYSNHGFALLGLIIEAVTGEPYASWMAREVIAAAGLSATSPDSSDLPVPPPPVAFGHSLTLPFGQRLVVPGQISANAITPAAGFVSTAADLVRFFSQLSPHADHSLLSAASRRDMTRRHWRDTHSEIERYYGLGTMLSAPGAWGDFGHSGGWQGTLTRTAVVPAKDLAISVLTNSLDGYNALWCDGIMHILKTFERHGAPDPSYACWAGRYWTLWGATDLVPVGKSVVLTAQPRSLTPFVDAAEIAIDGPDHGRLAKVQAYGSIGEPVRFERGADGKVTAVWLGGGKLMPEAEFIADARARYC